MLSFTEYFLAGEDEQEERAKNLKKGRFFGETILFFPRQCGGGIPVAPRDGARSCLAGSVPAFHRPVMTEMQEGVIRGWTSRLVMKKAAEKTV